ncbi:MAG: glycosyltransferase family 4 protein [Pseudomonadota bacterium]
MKIALIAPSGVPFAVGGAEKLWWGMLHHTNQLTDHQMELIKLPSPERNFKELIASYELFSNLDLDHFDRVLSTKYPAWMVNHSDHHLYLQHTLRGLYDTYPWPEHAMYDAFSPDAWPGGKSRQAIRLLRYHPDIARLRYLLGGRPEREQLPALFACIKRLVYHTLPSKVSDKLFALPSPLSRAVIHHLDAIAKSPGAIKSYNAISLNVLNRAQYFPQDVAIKVVHHPSDITWPEKTDNPKFSKRYLFTVSRLDAPKRIDLLVRAFLLTRVDADLWIAGTGPMEESLKQLAAEDPRIKFLGFKRDKEIAHLYQEAIAVPFLPFDEDYGLITIEAMQAGKPVITTHDAGGVNEFVRHGITGWSVASEPGALASAITEAVKDLQQTSIMGENARKAVAHVSWQDTIRELITDPGASIHHHFPTFTGERVKAHWLVLNTFPVYPPMGGGQNRMFHLYRNIASELGVKVTLLVLAPEGSTEQCLEIAPGLWEHRIPLSAQQADKQAALTELLGIPIDDLAAIEGFRDNPRFTATLADYAPQVSLGVCAHPYLVHAACEYLETPFLYEAHNVESRLKQMILAEHLGRSGVVGDCASEMLHAVQQAEKRACLESENIIACSDEDLIEFRQAYQISPDKGCVIPNCADLSQRIFIDQYQRYRWQQRLQQVGPVALFLGSWHGPNLEAADFICNKLAVECTDIRFLLAGSLCEHSNYQQTPPNVRALGCVTDQQLKVLLASVDVALNPMFSGSGSNLKMLDYTASGVPVLTTGFGNRGLGFNPQQVWLEQPAKWPEALRAILNASSTERQVRITQARTRTERIFSWPKAVKNLQSYSYK